MLYNIKEVEKKVDTLRRVGVKITVLKESSRIVSGYTLSCVGACHSNGKSDENE